MKAKNSIELNGKLYDAHTGRLIFDEPKHQTHQPAPAHHPKQATATTHTLPRGHSIDGVHPVHGGSNSKKTVSTPHHTTAPASQPKPTAHRPAPNSFKRKLHNSTTLHRGAVKPPHIRIDTSDEAKEDTKPEIAQKVDPQRLKRAQHVSKSSVISRFGGSKKSHEHEPARARIEESVDEQPIAPIEAQTTAPATVHHTAHDIKESHSSHIHKAAVAASSTHKSVQQRHKTHSRSKLFSYGASSLVVLLLAGYVAYLNIPSLSMKVAASRAGFAATMPTNRPAGYSLSGPVNASPGLVTINFGSNTDDRHFTLKQQPTTWDSQALLENYVTTKDKNYLTYQDRGLTVYIINGNDAAWVNGGKFYMVESQNSELDTDQILNLATSM